MEEVNFMKQDDHDVLITLNANFNTFLKQYHIDMKELKDNMALKLAEHESRLTAMEQLRDKIQPERIVSRVEENTVWIRDFKVSWRMILWVIGGASSLVTFLLTVLAFALNYIK